MGLFICRQLVERLDGGITAEALNDSGACFTFYLKVKRSVPPPSLVPTSAASIPTNQRVASSTNSRLSRPLRLILAEDNALLQKLTCKQLTKRGHEVLVADNGQIAIDLLQDELANNRTVHLVLLDIEMPVLDGPATVKRMQQLGIDIPCIAVTANARKEQQEAVLACGMAACVSKPFQVEQLLQVMYSLARV